MASKIATLLSLSLSLSSLAGRRDQRGGGQAADVWCGVQVGLEPRRPPGPHLCRRRCAPRLPTDTAGLSEWLEWLHPIILLNLREDTTTRHQRREYPRMKMLWPVGVGSENIREYPRISENFREFPRISENIREYPRISENIREYPRISENIREFPRISENGIFLKG